MRLFIGISLPPKITAELSAFSNRLHATGPATGPATRPMTTSQALRWSAPESWHVTLQFLGNATDEQYRCVISRLHEIHASTVPIQLEQTGFFDRAGVFFVGISLTPQLQTLQQRVTAATALCGFTPESRPYQPHITLARVKAKSSRQTFRQLKTKIRAQPRFTRFIAHDFLLYESVPTPSGSRYDIRQRFPLER